MTRRPRSKLPPHLPDPEPPRRREHAAPATTPRGRLIAARVTGPHARLGKSEIVHAVARLASGAADARFGLELGTVTREDAWSAIEEGWGWTDDRARAVIDPDRTLTAFGDAVDLLRAVGARGGRVAAATGCPSLLPVVRAMVTVAADAGAEVLVCHHWGPFPPASRSLWWVDGVAMVTDGAAFLADAGQAAGPEWLFAVGRPDLLVADGGFAGAALAAGHEAVVLADLDVPAFGLASARGLPAHLVPLAFGLPPSAYAPLVELAPSTHPPHSTTRAPGAYAPPESGGEG